MTNRYAIINASKEAINFVGWDGVSDFDYGQDLGYEIILIPADVSYGYGWIWNGTEFIDPTPALETGNIQTTGTEEF